MKKKIKFKIKKVKYLENTWTVTANSYDSKPCKVFNSKKEVDEYIDEWKDITLDEDHPYQVGTKWWFFDVDKDCILPVVIKEIRTKVGYNIFYSVLIFEDGELECKKYSTKENLEEVSKFLKKDYMEFINN